MTTNIEKEIPSTGNRKSSVGDQNNQPLVDSDKNNCGDKENYGPVTANNAFLGVADEDEDDHGPVTANDLENAFSGVADEDEDVDCPNKNQSINDDKIEGETSSNEGIVFEDFLKKISSNLSFSPEDFEITIEENPGETSNFVSIKVSVNKNPFEGETIKPFQENLSEMGKFKKYSFLLKTPSENLARNIDEFIKKQDYFKRPLMKNERKKGADVLFVQKGIDKYKTTKAENRKEINFKKFFHEKVGSFFITNDSRVFCSLE
jgi:hypothetical protein